MTSKQAFEYITNFDVENGSVCIKDIKKYQECCDIVEKAIDILEILKPRIKLSDKTIKQAVFSDYNKITQEREEKEIVFVSASGFVFKNSEEHKLLKEWLEK